MWKTRFEVSTSHSNGLTRYRSSSSSKIVHHYYSRPLPTVPRVRDDSPSAINRPSPPTSISNLDILIEEDEDILPTNLINNEQTNLLLSKQNSSQILNNNNKYQIVLPTILELNDHEHNQSIDEKYNIQLKQKKQDSFIPTNTNNNHILNCDNQRKEEKLNTKNKQIIEFTLNKRINQFLQKRIPRQNKLISSSIDINKNEIFIPNTFKEITAFFEQTSTKNLITQEKKILRAKRSLGLNRSISKNNNIKNLEINSSIEKESIKYNHQIKRIKTSHKFQSEFIDQNNLTKMNSNKLSKRWLIILFLSISMILINYYPLNIFQWIYIRNNSIDSSLPQSKESFNNNLIIQYVQFIRNYFFSLIDVFIKFISLLFFHIDKYEYKDTIIYVVTSTFELIYNWFIHLFE